MPTDVNKTAELHDRIGALRNQLVEVQHELAGLKRQLYQEMYAAYLERLERFQRENPGPQDYEFWCERVRPLCEDCQREIRKPDGHDLVVRGNAPPILCCGRHDPW